MTDPTCPNCGGLGHRDLTRRLPSGTLVTVGRPCQVCEGRRRVDLPILERWQAGVRSPPRLHPWRR